MENPKRQIKKPNRKALLFKSITFHATKYTLWQLTHTAEPIEFPVQSIIPSFKLAKTFKFSLSKFFKEQKKKSSQVFMASTSPSLFTLNQYDLLGISSSFPNDSHSIPLIQSLSLDKSNYEGVLEKVSQKVENFEIIEQLNIFDLCAPLMHYQVQHNSMKLAISIIMPSVSFHLHPVSSLKLVSTPLCQSLTKKETQGFQSGFLTVDDKRRFIPLQFSDKHILRFPLVGVWAAGCEEVSGNKQVWCNFVRFIETASVKERISQNPAAGSFIFINFSKKVKFFEVKFSEPPGWKAVTRCIKPDSNELFFTEENVKKSFTASTASSEGRCSRETEELGLTEKIILKQNEMLKNLEKQINELQHALSEPKLVNSCTNTSKVFKECAGYNGMRKGNMLRNSCELKLRPSEDLSINVPKIIYRPETESDDDFSLELVDFI